MVLSKICCQCTILYVDSSVVSAIVTGRGKCSPFGVFDDLVMERTWKLFSHGKLRVQGSLNFTLQPYRLPFRLHIIHIGSPSVSELAFFILTIFVDNDSTSEIKNGFSAY